MPQRAATRTPDGELSVWVIDANNQARLKIIKVNRALGDQWVVIEGLAGGENIVVEGYQRLSPGAQVSTAPWSAPAASATNQGA